MRYDIMYEFKNGLHQMGVPFWLVCWEPQVETSTSKQA